MKGKIRFDNSRQLNNEIKSAKKKLDSFSFLLFATTEAKLTERLELQIDRLERLVIKLKLRKSKKQYQGWVYDKT
jgi:hypothetical protein